MTLMIHYNNLFKEKKKKKKRYLFFFKLINDRWLKIDEMKEYLG